MQSKRQKSEYVLLSLIYIIGRIVIYGLIVLSVILAYSVGRDYMGVRVIIKDALNKRASIVIKEEESDILPKVFTGNFLENDLLLNSSTYNDYSIRDFIYLSSTDFILIFPWQDSVTVISTEQIPYINGELKDNPENDENVNTVPPEWQDGKYKISLIRQDNSWKIDKMELIEVLPKALPLSPSPSVVSPSPVLSEKPSNEPVPSPNE